MQLSQRSRKVHKFYRHSAVIAFGKISKTFLRFRGLAGELLLRRHEFSTGTVLRQHSANISTRMLCFERGKFN